jgi:hypothetical protein
LCLKRLDMQLGNAVFLDVLCMLVASFVILLLKARKLLTALVDISLVTQVLIQLGDILDRGEDEIAILSLLRSLDLQAKAKGGAVFQVGAAKNEHF